MKIIVQIFIVMLLFLISLGFFSPILPTFNPFLVLLVYVLIFFGELNALLWSATAGFMLDLFSPLPFGSFLICFCVLYFLLKYLNLNFFVNQSLFTLLILTTIAHAFLIIYLLAEKSLINAFGQNYYIAFSLRNLFAGLVVNLLLGLVLFFNTRFFTSRLRLDILSH